MRSFNQEIEYTAEGYERFLLNAYIRTKNLKGNAGLIAVVVGSDGKQGYVYASENDGIKADVDWTVFSIQVIVGPGKSKMFLGGVIYGEGTAWFDDLSFVPAKVSNSNQAKKMSAYVKEYLKIVRENALNPQAVDLNELEMIVTDLTKGATTASECYPAFRFGLTLLRDGHSHFFTPASITELNQRGGEKDTKNIDFPIGRMIDSLGYIVVPGLPSGNEIALRKYADTLQAIIRFLDVSRPQGWIIDLRRNSGGNCWPMIAGLGPLIEDEECGFIFQKGTKSKAIKYSRGGSRIGEEIMCKVTNPYKLVTRDKKIAVLTGRGTNSSGEVVAICFGRRPNTALIGARTSGLSTNNSMLSLSDGAVLNLTTGVYADRTKTQYPSGITPDVQVPINDDVLTKAVAWIKFNR